MSPQQRTGVLAVAIAVGLFAVVGCLVAAISIAKDNKPDIGPDQGAGSNRALPDDLRESAAGYREVVSTAIAERDIGKTVVVTGRVETRTFDGFEGQQLLRGDKVSARMFVAIHPTKKILIKCLFRPTTRKDLLPEIETTVRVIGTVTSVTDYTTWSEEKRREFRAKDEKYVSMEDCRFAR